MPWHRASTWWNIAPSVSLARYRLWTMVNTFIFRTREGMISCHQIAIVFTSPRGRAHSLSRYHHHCPPGWSIAHCTWDIVLENCRLWSADVCLIFCPIEVRTTVLYAVCVTQVVWVIREAEILSSTSSLVIPTSSSSSCIDELCSRSSWTCGPPPPSVHHPTSSGTRGTSRTSVSLLSSQACLA